MLWSKRTLLPVERLELKRLEFKRINKCNHKVICILYSLCACSQKSRGMVCQLLSHPLLLHDFTNFYRLTSKIIPHTDKEVKHKFPLTIVITTTTMAGHSSNLLFSIFFFF